MIVNYTVFIPEHALLPKATTTQTMLIQDSFNNGFQYFWLFSAVFLPHLAIYKFS